MNPNATIQTLSGRYARIPDLLPHHIDIGDIGHALSNICRFGGHTRAFYSVAQHSYLVSRIVPPEHALTALLHDATEAYVGDMVLPLKQLLPDYQRIEAEVWCAIADAFGLPVELPACVKHADRVLLATERRDLMKDQDTRWEVLDGIDPLPEAIDPWKPDHARAVFVVQFWELRKAQHRMGGLSGVAA